MDLWILIILLITVILFIKSRLNYWNNLNVLNFKTEFPYGNIKHMGKKYHVSKFLCDFYKLVKENNEKFCGIYLIMKPIFFLVDLDLIKAVMIKDFNIFPNR